MECQAFAMQFVFFRPLTAVALLICQHLNYTKLNLYFTIIQNVSIFLAFAGLLKFYHAVDKELSWCKPFAKFLCIKGVVFMTFWQGLAITILASTRHNAQSRTQWAASAQNFLVCLEMLLFSIAHYYTYPPDEWTENYQEKMKKRQRIDRHFGDSLALNDFLSDLKLIIRYVTNTQEEEDEEEEGICSTRHSSHTLTFLESHATLCVCCILSLGSMVVVLIRSCPLVVLHRPG